MSTVGWLQSDPQCKQEQNTKHKDLKNLPIAPPTKRQGFLPKAEGKKITLNAKIFPLRLNAREEYLSLSTSFNNTGDLSQDSKAERSKNYKDQKEEITFSLFEIITVNIKTEGI